MVEPLSFFVYNARMSKSETFDVVVCGGGPAGWVAAVAAARKGAKTALIERYGFFGGTATAGLVIPISGYFKNEQRIVGGIAWEFVQKLKKLNAAKVEYPKGHVSVDTEYYKLVAQRMLLEAGVSLFTNSYIHDVVKDCNRITSVVFSNKNGTESVSGKVFIDATGDGDLWNLCKMPFKPSENNQPLSFCFELSGVDCTTDLLKNYIHHDGVGTKNSLQSEIHEYLQSEYEKGNCPQFGGPWFNTTMRGDVIAVNVTRICADAVNNREYAKAEFKLREDIFTITELLKKHYKEFENCHISATAVNAGIRETRRIEGEYTLTGEDLIEGKRFDDTVALSGHPIDLHIAGSNSQNLIKTDNHGNIPFRCLYNKMLENVLVAGRCLSADDTAYASVRVQATLMAIGQAAGTASLMAAEKGISVADINIENLREILIQDGAVV